MKIKSALMGCIGLLLVILLSVLILWVLVKMRETTIGNDEIVTIPTQTQQPNQPQTQPNQPNDYQIKSDNLALGNPSNATSNAANSNNYLMINDEFAMSYSRANNLANWVSWQLTAKDMGDTERQNDFRPDERLPYGYTKILPNDYSRSGFDKGHLCPSADRTNSMKANSETFLMTNISPQTSALNQGPWEKLETYSRSMARRGVDLYIIAGHYGNRGKMKGKVTIPTNFWKIIVVVPKNKGVQGIDVNTRVIAVDMPNNDNIMESGWRDFKTTVRQIEQKTGYNFLSNLPKNLQDALETKVDVREGKN